MGMFRDLESVEIDLVKEMAEGLGSTGLRLEELLEKIQAEKEKIDQLTSFLDESGSFKDKQSVSLVNESIRVHNNLVDKAWDTLRWLLIQREACGFRRHKDVDYYYPIPPKLRPIDL
jgi:hypothetical protein